MGASSPPDSATSSPIFCFGTSSIRRGHQSRPGAGVGAEAEVSQAARSGTYVSCFEQLPSPNNHPHSSAGFVSPVRARQRSAVEFCAAAAHLSASPGRVYLGIMGDPRPPATVEPPCQRRVCSRPAPVRSDGNGVSQTACSGKYTSNDCTVLSGSDLSLDSSTIPVVAAVQTEPTERRFLTVYYQNVRGLRTKTNETFMALCRCDYDVIVFTETWLTEAIKDAELTKNYELFRCDRNPGSSSLLRGGGVLIATKVELRCKTVDLLNCESLEQTVIRLALPLQTLFLCCVYIRPVSDPAVYTTHASAVQQVIDLSKQSDSILVVGDYNLPNLIWFHDDDTDSLLPINASSEQEVTLVESMLSLGLIQVNELPNAFGKLLDLVFVSDNVSVELFEPPCPLLKVDQHHNPLLMKLEYKTVPSENLFEPEAVFDFKKCNYTTLNERILAVDWLTLLDVPSINCGRHFL